MLRPFSNRLTREIMGTPLVAKNFQTAPGQRWDGKKTGILLFYRVHLLVLFHELLVHLFPDTFFRMPAPLDTRYTIVIDDKAAFLAGDFEIV